MPRLTTLPNDGGHVALMVAWAIPFQAICKQHRLPFSGAAHIGYLLAERILGPCGLARLIADAAARPQNRERLTRQIADPAPGHSSLPCATARTPRGSEDCLKVYTDHASSTKTDQPHWQACLADLRPGDTLVIWKIDRLDRSLRDLIDIVTILDQCHVVVRSLTDGALPRLSGQPGPARRRSGARSGTCLRPGWPR